MSVTRRDGVMMTTTDADFAAALGRAVRTVRERDGWSQADLAIAAGINHGYVSRIEAGRRTPTLSVLRRIARALDDDVSALLASAEGDGHD